ncbi:hypothetical protein [Rubinisphaera margarita]|uniref:hypothetical protein n=1 Tax=Rubinisphaera margarita TaxID=2909586 RepID=UPI001EE8AFEC|nr:hypothetical protein [Rubinisphaera margarita]MCG6156076.1 hypothetical protein [Rubinisphaera margarita]
MSTLRAIEFPLETFPANSEARSSESPRTGAWIRRSVLLDRRNVARSPAAFDVEVTPVNELLVAQSSPIEGTILNFSQGGLCLEHADLIVEPYVRLDWVVNDVHHNAIVKLRWCRALGADRYLSGGRVIGIS